MSGNVAILDVETTGLPNEEWARVVELGAVALSPEGNALGTFEETWCPDILDARAERALALSGRTLAELFAEADGGSTSTNSLVDGVRERFTRWLNNYSIVEVWSYNRVFDEGMLERSGFFLPWAGCVMRLARNAMPHKTKDPSLDEAAHFFGVQRLGQQHRALPDAAVAAGVYLAARDLSIPMQDRSADTNARPRMGDAGQHIATTWTTPTGWRP